MIRTVGHRIKEWWEDFRLRLALRIYPKWAEELDELNTDLNVSENERRHLINEVRKLRGLVKQSRKE